MFDDFRDGPCVCLSMFVECLKTHDNKPASTKVNKLCLHVWGTAIISSVILICLDKWHRNTALTHQAFLILWRGMHIRYFQQTKCAPLCGQDRCSTLDLIWLKIAGQNDGKVLQFFHFPASEDPVPSKGYKMPMDEVPQNNDILPTKMYFPATAP